MANPRRLSSRHNAAVPSGEVLASFDVYAKAQGLVTTLVGAGVPATALSIVGTDVTVVERVTGRMGHGRAALSSAMSGSWLGVLAGLIYAVFIPEDFVTPVLAGLLIGAGAGMVVGMLLFTFSKGPKKNFRSFQQVLAAKYDVVVSTTAYSEALTAMESAAKTGGS